MTQTYIGNGAPTGNPWIDTLINGDRWEQAPGQPAYINYWFQFADTDPRGELPPMTDPWTDEEKASMRKAQATWEAVANVKFVEAANADAADVWYWKDWALWTEGAAGGHGFPSNEKPLYGRFDTQEQAWTEEQRAPGGFTFATFVMSLATASASPIRMTAVSSLTRPASPASRTGPTPASMG